MGLLNLFSDSSKTFDPSSIKYKKNVDQQLVEKLVDYLSNLKAHRLMVKIDGGLNCALICLLLEKTLRKDVSLMIIDVDSSLTEKSIALCDNLQLDSYVLDRTKSYQNEILGYKIPTGSAREKFFKRFCNYHILTQADQMDAVLIDDFDKSNRLLGTRPTGFYGQFMPFYSLYKSELYDLAKFLNTPSQFFEDQTNQYWDQIDPLLFLLTEKQLAPEEISQQFNVDLEYLKKLKTKIDKQMLQKTISEFFI